MDQPSNMTLQEQRVYLDPMRRHCSRHGMGCDADVSDDDFSLPAPVYTPTLEQDTSTDPNNTEVVPRRPQTVSDELHSVQTDHLIYVRLYNKARARLLEQGLNHLPHLGVFTRMNDLSLLQQRNNEMARMLRAVYAGMPPSPNIPPVREHPPPAYADVTPQLTETGSQQLNTSTDTQLSRPRPVRQHPSTRIRQSRSKRSRRDPPSWASIEAERIVRAMTRPGGETDAEAYTSWLFSRRTDDPRLEQMWEAHVESSRDDESEAETEAPVTQSFRRCRKRFLEILGMTGGVIICGFILYGTFSGIRKSIDEGTKGTLQDDGEFF